MTAAEQLATADATIRSVAAAITPWGVAHDTAREAVLQAAGVLGDLDQTCDACSLLELRRDIEDPAAQAAVMALLEDYLPRDDEGTFRHAVAAVALLSVVDALDGVQ